jgi:hypothetical protein
MRKKQKIDDATLPDRFAVLERRIKGESFREIADKMQISLATAHGWYRWALETFFEEPTAEARTLDLARCDKLINAWLPLAIGEGPADKNGKPTAVAPDAKAADLVLKIMKQRQDLLEPLYASGDAGIDEVVQEALMMADALGIDPARLLATAHERVTAEFWIGDKPPMVLDLDAGDDSENI